jgi:hypothetical protein
VGVWQNAQEGRRQRTQHAGFNALATRNRTAQHDDQFGLVLGERRTVGGGDNAGRGVHAQVVRHDLNDRPAASTPHASAALGVVMQRDRANSLTHFGSGVC